MMTKEESTKILNCKVCTRNMETILLRYYFDNFLDENDNDRAVYLTRSLTIFALLSQKRFITRVTNFTEDIVALFDTRLFRSHFRVTPAVYGIILREVQGHIVSIHGGGTEQIEPASNYLYSLRIWQVRNL